MFNKMVGWSQNLPTRFEVAYVGLPRFVNQRFNIGYLGRHESVII